MPLHEILHLLGPSDVEGTSIARTVALLAEGLDPREFKLHAWFMDGPGPLVGMLEKKGVEVRVINWFGTVRHPSGLWRLWRSFGRGRYALVHQHTGGRSVRWVCRYAGGARVIVHLHGRVLEQNWEVPARCNVDGADLVIAASKTLAGWSGVDAEVVYPGADVRPPGHFSRGGPGLVIGTAGRLEPIKGVEFLVRAMPAVRAAVPDATLEVAGSGDEEPALKAEVRRLNLAGCVRFLGWQNNIPFDRWDVFVMPSLEESFGISALEAMAAGLPVVASAVGGLTELVEDGKTGLLVPPSDPQALAARLIELLQNARKRKEMGSAGLARARDFSTARMTERIELLYRRLLSG